MSAKESVLCCVSHFPLGLQKRFISITKATSYICDGEGINDEIAFPVPCGHFYCILPVRTFRDRPIRMKIDYPVCVCLIFIRNLNRKRMNMIDVKVKFEN